MVGKVREEAIKVHIGGIKFILVQQQIFIE